MTKIIICDIINAKGVEKMFGIRLKFVRQKRKYTLDGLAALYNEKFEGGINKGTLSKYENEKQEPKMTVVKNLSDILNVSADFLMGNSPLMLSSKATDAIKKLQDYDIMKEWHGNFDIFNKMIESEYFDELMCDMEAFDGIVNNPRAFDEYIKNFTPEGRKMIFQMYTNNDEFQTVTKRMVLSTFEKLIDDIFDVQPPIRGTAVIPIIKAINQN